MSRYSSLGLVTVKNYNDIKRKDVAVFYKDEACKEIRNLLKSQTCPEIKPETLKVIKALVGFKNTRNWSWFCAGDYKQILALKEIRKRT